MLLRLGPSIVPITLILGGQRLRMPSAAAEREASGSRASAGGPRPGAAVWPRSQVAGTGPCEVAAGFDSSLVGRRVTNSEYSLGVICRGGLEFAGVVRVVVHEPEAGKQGLPEEFDLLSHVGLGDAAVKVDIQFEKQVPLVVEVGFQEAPGPVPQVDFFKRLFRLEPGAELEAARRAVLHIVEQGGAAIAFHFENHLWIACFVPGEFGIKAFFSKNVEQLLAGDSVNDCFTVTCLRLHWHGS